MGVRGGVVRIVTGVGMVGMSGGVVGMGSWVVWLGWRMPSLAQRPTWDKNRTKILKRLWQMLESVHLELEILLAIAGLDFISVLRPYRVTLLEF